MLYVLIASKGTQTLDFRVVPSFSPSMVDAGGGTRKAALPVELTLEHVSPVTRLLEKRKKMLQVQENLEAQKDEYQRKAVHT